VRLWKHLSISNIGLEEMVCSLSDVCVSVNILTAYCLIYFNLFEVLAHMMI
jgi:hypothetical protein